MMPNQYAICKVKSNYLSYESLLFENLLPLAKKYESWHVILINLQTNTKKTNALIVQLEYY